MKFRLSGRRGVLGAIAIALSLPMAVQAQGVIQKAGEPYIAKPEIVFTLASSSTAVASAGAAKAATLPLLPPRVEYSNLSVFGDKPAEHHGYPGSQDASLREAVRAMTPSTYAVRSAACAPMQAPAPYPPGSDWVAGLNRVAAATGVNVSIDHDTREVMVLKKSAIDPDAKRSWAILASDTTLKRALERWTTPACISLQWDVPYAIEAATDTFYEDKTLWEALALVAQDMESSKSPVRIIKHRNNTVHVYVDSSR